MVIPVTFACSGHDQFLIIYRGEGVLISNGGGDSPEMNTGEHQLQYFNFFQGLISLNGESRVQV